MNILIIGNGGREHALAGKPPSLRWRIKLRCAGQCRHRVGANLENVAIAATDIPALVAFAQSHDIGLTIVGPEAPLVIGVVDAFQAAGLKIFGRRRPPRSSKAPKPSPGFLARHRIPTAEYENFTEVEPALAYVRRKGAPIVIKPMAGGR